MSVYYPFTKPLSVKKVCKLTGWWIDTSFDDGDVIRSNSDAILLSFRKPGGKVIGLNSRIGLMVAYEVDCDADNPADFQRAWDRMQIMLKKLPIDWSVF